MDLVSNLSGREIEIAMSGATSVSPDTFGYYEATVEHNLGYVPAVAAYFAFAITPTSFKQFNYFIHTSSTNYYRFLLQASQTRIFMSVELGSGVGAGAFGTYPLKYFIFRSSAK